MTILWPHYRRSSNGAHLYRIEAADRFTELQRLGRRWILHVVRDAPYPERVRIRDMVDGLGGTYEELDAETFEQALADASAQAPGPR